MRRAWPAWLLCAAALAAELPVDYKTELREQPGRCLVRATRVVIGGESPLAGFAVSLMDGEREQAERRFLAEVEQAPEEATCVFDHRPLVSIASETLISVYATEYLYLGGVQGESRILAYNFARRAGLPARLELSDLFRDGTDPRGRVEPALLALLREHPSADWVRDGTVTELPPEALESFVITRTAISWLLGAELVGPRPSGLVVLKLPLAELRDALDPAGPLRELLAAQEP